MNISGGLSVRGIKQYKDFLDRHAATHIPQTVLNSVSTINTATSVETTNTVSNFDTKIVTPGITYFQTEYARALDVNGHIKDVIISYDTMCSLSIGSKLVGLDHNPDDEKTITLPVKTLYDVTKKSFEVFHIKLKRFRNTPSISPFVKLEVYYDNSYSL